LLTPKVSEDAFFVGFFNGFLIGFFFGGIILLINFKKHRVLIQSLWEFGQKLTAKKG
jgi:hypothetical protein